MATNTFLAIAFKINPAIKPVWIDKQRSNIIETMKECKIYNMEIIDSANQFFPPVNESFEKYHGTLSDLQIQLFCFLFIFGRVEGVEPSKELVDKVKCFYINFLTRSGISESDYQQGTSIILYKFTGQSNRHVIFSHQIQPETPETPETPEKQPIDCSKYINKFESLNTDKIILQRELDDCQTSKKTLEQENDNILTKLDGLKEQIRQFKSKDPEQIRQNIINLQRELDKIQREAEEEQRRQQDTEEQQRRQREAEEQQRRAAEEQQRRAAEEQQRRQREAEEQQRRSAEEQQRRSAEEQQRRQQPPPAAGQEFDFAGIPPACTTVSTIYNDYNSQKKKLISLITENKKRVIVEKILDATVKRLDGIRAISIRGDAGATGCEPFESWYIKNKSWFIKEFEEIKGLVSQYNRGKPASDTVTLPLDAGKQFNFSGGKFRRTKRNIKKTRKGYKKTINKRHRSKKTTR
jgi:hypothetical protein